MTLTPTILSGNANSSLSLPIDLVIVYLFCFLVFVSLTIFSWLSLGKDGHDVLTLCPKEKLQQLII